MPIEMPRGLPFSVDTFSPSSRAKRHHFLTHAHKDHTAGLPTHGSFPVYSTHLTKTLLLQHPSQLDQFLFVEIEVGQSVVIDDPDGEFVVTAFDANHCPGSVMYLFEGNFGNILHTGDCRLTPECLQCLPEKYVSRKGEEPHCRLDFVFLDCTFAKFSLGFPSKHSAIRQVINCIWRHPDALVVYLACDLLGQESILLEVSRTFGSKIFIEKASNPEFFQSLMVIAPDIISQDPSSRFRLFEGFPKLCERASAKIAEARYNLQPEPLIIRPSAQWYARDEESEIRGGRKVRFNEAVRDEYGIWHVCYSIHSSREELEHALQLLTPKWVVSTTPSCRATELDYVNRNCFVSRVTSNDLLWKLLDIDFDTTMEPANDSMIATGCCPIEEEVAGLSGETQLNPLIKSPIRKELSSWSPRRKTLPVTLFGRARLGFEHCDKRIVSERHENKRFHKVLEERIISLNSDVKETSYVGHEALQNVSNGTQGESSAMEEEHAETLDEPKSERAWNVEVSESGYTFGRSKSLSENLRKLYRSMNVPVPQPLPSLIDLMDARKRARRRFEF